MKSNTFTPLGPLLILVIIAMAVGACTSAEEVLNDGIELEEKGSYEDAAWKYIRALRKDDDLEEARERLEWVSDTLVTMYLARVDQASDAGRSVEAAEAILEIDRLDDASREVGVSIGLPDSYRSLRRETLDDAISYLESRARSAIQRRDFGEADDLARDALERFDPDPETRYRLERTRFDILLGWADDLSSRGIFREAVRKTDEALAIAEAIEIDPSPAHRLRDAALEAGTVYVASTPVWRSGGTARTMSPGFLADLNDRLELDFWSTPPEFVAFAHPALVRRRLRSLDLDRRSLSRREGRIIARDLDADYAVIADIDRYEFNERDVNERQKTTKTRSGKPAVYYEIRGRVEINARMSYAIVDANGNVVKDGTIQERRSRDFKRADYDGDYRDLDISGSTRDLFDGDDYDESMLQLEEDLAQRLAERLGNTVFDRIIDRIR